jgi:hypothetical protein
MFMRILPMLLVVAIAGAGALSFLIVEADKARRAQSESQRRDQQWRIL